MKTPKMTHQEAVSLNARIEDATAVLTALDTLALAASIRGEHGLVNLVRAAVPPAARVLASLQVRFEDSGYEIHRTSPMVRTVVLAGASMHDSLEMGGAVGEGALPDDDLMLAGAEGFIRASKTSSAHFEAQRAQQKPVTEEEKPVTDEPEVTE